MDVTVGFRFLFLSNVFKWNYISETCYVFNLRVQTGRPEQTV